MADLYLKALESERKALWATCRLKGLPKDTPERKRILELDELLRAHKAKSPKPVKPAKAAKAVKLAKPAKPKAPAAQ